MIKHYSRTSLHNRLEYGTAELWENMVSPLCGILTRLYAYHRQAFDPKGMAMSGELTRVASYRGLSSEMNYHIGGMGLNREDAMIKCLAEAYERYIPVFYDPEKFLTCSFNSYNHLKTQYPDDILPEERIFHYFSGNQFTQKQFFTPFDADQPMLWVRLPEIVAGKQSIWIPAQLIFFGYLPKKYLGENRINSSVSTGTAVHRSLTPCLLNSLLEMIMIDSTIAHWYTKHPAYKIEMTDRTRHIRSIIKKSIPHSNIKIEFYWIPCLDMPVFNVACLARSDSIPKLSVGLGSDTTLEGAMYKAFIEYFGTRLLGQSLAVLQENEIEVNRIQNLDDNVLYYALGNGSEIVDKKFNPESTLRDTDLPKDLLLNKREVINLLLKRFLETEKNIAYLDLTNPESKELNLVATKLWCPQFITVPIPSAVPVNHVRFQDYGGVTHLEPHPYA